jgi:hypothetical protein
MGANVFRRLQIQRDPLRMSAQVESSRFDSVRRRQTLQNSLTREEVTGSNLVRPTPFFEILSTA